MLQIVLSGNSINFIDPTAFSGSIPSLIALDNNQLTFLDPNVFEKPVRNFGSVLDVSSK